jgi:hypothetical protein
MQKLRVGRVSREIGYLLFLDQNPLRVVGQLNKSSYSPTNGVRLRLPVSEKTATKLHTEMTKLFAEQEERLEQSRLQLAQYYENRGQTETLGEYKLRNLDVKCPRCGVTLTDDNDRADNDGCKVCRTTPEPPSPEWKDLTLDHIMALQKKLVEDDGEEK